ncbi:hypothetical protein J6590_003474 [Homalodisca vitripennis]|nr:hypothetical protein J6590_003474 [Homalodisca vitripennis]
MWIHKYVTLSARLNTDNEIIERTRGVGEFRSTCRTKQIICDEFYCLLGLATTKLKLYEAVVPDGKSHLFIVPATCYNILQVIVLGYYCDGDETGHASPTPHCYNFISTTQDLRNL